MSPSSPLSSRKTSQTLSRVLRRGGGGGGSFGSTDGCSPDIGAAGESDERPGAGGIRASKQALRYLVMVNETVGDLWMTPDMFRFGASTLLNDLLMQWVRLSDGVHQRPNDFSVD